MENLEQNKDIVAYYLALSVKQQFNIDIDLTNEFIFTENLVSKKIIIAPTFSDKILSVPELKEFLSALISYMNNEQQSEKLPQHDSEEVRNIV